jgi:hypothetical protein
MPNVYITQLPHRRDTTTNSLVPAFNIHPAGEHGEIVVMMPPQAAFITTGQVVRQLTAKLIAYNYGGGDSLLLLGDTTLVACATAILAKRHQQFTILRWEKNLGRYTRVVIGV